jgi:hypothetical protein
MSIVESENVVGREDLAAADLPVATTRKRPPRWLQRLPGLLLGVFTAQYFIVAIGTGLTVAGTLHYMVTPKIVATFETLAAALKR